MRVPLERGRLFTAADRIGAPKVVLVTETVAKRFWPNDDPIGKHVGIYQGGFAGGAEVIGIVGDVRTIADSAPQPDVYLPYAQSPQSDVILFLRTTVEPTTVVAAARRSIHDLAAGYPVYDVQTMSARVAAATAQPRFSAVLLGLFAAVALTLAVVGIYGVMTYLVSQRTREIGIRMALGADRRTVIQMIVGEGMALVGWGAAAGLVGALTFTRLLRSMLFDLSPADPATYLTILVVLSGAAILASWIPARRAARVDPLITLKTD
jgi:putative ABC transport system permease protein